MQYMLTQEEYDELAGGKVQEELKQTKQKLKRLESLLNKHAEIRKNNLDPFMYDRYTIMISISVNGMDEFTKSIFAGLLHKVEMQ